MTSHDIDRISAWVVQQGLAGADETELLQGFSRECHAAGLPLTTSVAVVDTLHPVYEGRAFFWRNDGIDEEPVLEYRSTATGEEAERWKRTAFYHLLSTEADDVRRCLGRGDPADFYLLDELQAEGQTDYFALAHRFSRDRAFGEMDCIFTHWTTNHPECFTDDHLAALRRLVPFLSLAIKSASLARVAGTLVEVYLGRDAGRRVLNGKITRGTTEQINAVLWFSDLRGYTSITDSVTPSEIIPLLNDYAEAVISAIHEAGGDVLKLMGDGILAVFREEDSASSCRAALRAESSLREKLVVLNERRATEGRPVTTVYLGLHTGEVFYGNIGSDQRLDFTVVGPAVNETARIASMCRSVDRTLVMSADFAAATPAPERNHLVSVGRYALRGVAHAQELFTLDTAALLSRSGGTGPK